MDSLRRGLNIELEKGQSAFLWGPRKTGKSTWLKQAFPHNHTAVASLFHRPVGRETDCLTRISHQLMR